MKDIEDRKLLAKNKKKNKEGKQLIPKEKQDNRYFFRVSKDFMRLRLDLVYKSNLPVSLKNTKNLVLELGIKNVEIQS